MFRAFKQQILDWSDSNSKSTDARTREPEQAKFLSQHPEANQEVCLQGFWIAYRLQRSKRRTSIGFVVSQEGLSVKTPMWLESSAVAQALQDKSTWVVRKLVDQAALQQQLQAVRIDWQDGKPIAYLGQPMLLPLDLPDGASPAQRREATYAWFQRQAQRIFTERLDWYAPLLGVKYHRLKISSAGTRWGSASSDGSIRLNWRLLHFSLALVDYVIVHELSHLRHMNHSADFWATVHSVMPDYKERHRGLKQSLAPLWD